MSFQRTRFSLNGKWLFWADPQGLYSPSNVDFSKSSVVSVPAPMQSQGTELHLFTGPAWYRRTFEFTDPPAAGHSFIGFDAADEHAEVWLNGTQIGSHSGGYLPFELDVTDVIKPGENILVVRITDPPETFAEVPHGKQSWYGPLSGLWQPVWVESRSSIYLKALKVQPDLSTGKVACQINFSQPTGDDTQLVFHLSLPSGREIDAGQVRLDTGSLSAGWGFNPPEILPWSPQSPHLYRLEARLICQGEETDLISKTIGFRTIEARNGHLYLNGEMFYLRGALDQDYYPDTICTPPSRDFIEDEMRKARALGLNCLRIHIKVPDPSYYEIADRLGMLVWAELPSFSFLTEGSSENGRRTLAGILERDGHHPSIIAWSIINEGWGLDLVNDSSHRLWLSETFTWFKQQDPTRLIIDNSACTPNFHLLSDLDDYHYYRGMPDHRRQWVAFLDDYAARPDWTYSPAGDAQRRGDEPLLLSEFGNWGLPDANLLKDRNGQEPWWFDTGNDWGEGTVYPHGVQARFRSLGLDRIFESWESFIAATQWSQFDALKFEIESLRLHPQIQGYVITELTDVHWECNGLMDMQRRVKAYGESLAAVNADTVIIPTVERTAWWSDEPVKISVHLAFADAGISIKDCQIRWKAPAWGAEGSLPLANVEPGETVFAGFALLPATGSIPAAGSMPASGSNPASENKSTSGSGGTKRTRITFELLGPHNEKFASNYLDLSLFPRKHRETSSGRALWSPSPLLAEQITRAGYTLAPSQAAASLVIANELTPDLLAAVGNGAWLLLLAENVGAIKGGMFGLGLVSREGTLWNGDWVSSFGWLRRDGPFSRLPGNPLMDESFEPFIPEINLAGFSLWDYQSSPGHTPAVYAGQFLGWVHKPAAWIGRRSYGKGQVTISTFRLQGEEKMANPVGITLFDGLIELAVQ